MLPNTSHFSYCDLSSYDFDDTRDASPYAKMQENQVFTAARRAFNSSSREMTFSALHESSAEDGCSTRQFVAGPHPSSSISPSSPALEDYAPPVHCRGFGAAT